MTRPETLGKYQITGVLGTGAMGVVYTGFDPGIRRSVAIKTIHKKLVDDPVQAESLAARFRNEAQAVGRLMHPGIVAIYEYGEDGATSFIAMELVQGRSLAKVMATHTLPESDVLKLMDQLLDALGFAHRNGVLHRDIKPANLILTADGVLKVTDFGIARIENIALTQVDLVIGTPGYMAPEQYVGDAIDQRVDVFAAGALLYRMLTGEAPFTGTYEQVMYKILNEDPVPPSRLPGGEEHGKYDAIVAKALAKDRDQRYHAASELRAALASVARSIGIDGMDTTVVLRHESAIAAWRSGREPASQAGSNHGAAHPSHAGSGAGSHPGSHAGSGSGSSQGSGAHGNPGSNPGAGTQLTPIPGWDPALLAKLERILASYIGPLARMLVRQSAKKTLDLGALTIMLAEHIDTASARKTFVDKAQALTPSGSTIGRPAPQPVGNASMNPPTLPPARLTDATVDYALKTLSRHVGPIAKVIVRQAATRATSSSHFFELLADQAGIDRAKLIAELQRGPS